MNYARQTHGLLYAMKSSSYTDRLEIFVAPSERYPRPRRRLELKVSTKFALARKRRTVWSSGRLLLGGRIRKVSDNAISACNRGLVP